MPTLLIGMVVIGFGTSAPEMVVSAIAASDGNPGLALGNGYGSNIVNIALILGITALIAPIMVHSSIIRKELPILVGITLFSGALLLDGAITRLDAVLLLLLFAALIGWSIYAAMRSRGDTLESETEAELEIHDMPLSRALMWLFVGLVLLIISSRVLVWGAVNIAQDMGVSDLIIGLTIVALGTSLPELASSIIAARKGEHDLAIGNIVGSNLFNTLTVVGIAGAIMPMHALDPQVLSRDWATMLGVTLLLFAVAYGFKGKGGRINRTEGALLLLVYVAYNAYLVSGLITA
jgi:cation:H+ antiporter